MLDKSKCQQHQLCHTLQEMAKLIVWVCHFLSCFCFGIGNEISPFRYAVNNLFLETLAPDQAGLTIVRGFCPNLNNWEYKRTWLSDKFVGHIANMFKHNTSPSACRYQRYYTYRMQQIQDVASKCRMQRTVAEQGSTRRTLRYYQV